MNTMNLPVNIGTYTTIQTYLDNTFKLHSLYTVDQ